MSDTIAFAKDVRLSTISLTQGTLEVKPGKGYATVTIDGANRVGIDAHFASSVFQVDRGAHLDLERLGIEHGSAAYGGAVLNYGQLAVNACVFDSNVASCGGAIYDASSSILTVTGSWFNNNHAYNQGGAIDNWGSAMIFNSTFSHNGANYGGGIINWGRATLQGDLFDHNVVSYTGGGLYNGASVSLDSCTFSGNYATSGGAIGVFGSMNFSDCKFNGNHAATAGGALYVGNGYMSSLHPGAKLSHYTGNTAPQNNDSYFA